MRFLLSLLLLLVWASPSFAAPATQPDSSWILAKDLTFTAKDKSFSIRQYQKDEDIWQIWVFPKNQPAYLLKDPELDYCQDCAVWYPSPDGHWLARSQRIGSGTYTLQLYRCDKNQPLVPVAKVPLGYLAQDFYEKHSGLTHEQCFIDHPVSEFVKWEGSRHLILALSGQSTLCQPMWVTHQWLVGYDLVDRKFFLTEKLIDKNVARIYPVIHPVSEAIPKGR